MVSLPRAIQGVILFSTAFGAVFLYEVYPLVPDFVFYSVAFGWVLFVADSVLTFVRPKLSFYLGMALAIIALAVTLATPEHFQFIASGNVPATATLVVGWASEILLILLVGLYIRGSRREDPWRWPGEEPSA